MVKSVTGGFRSRRLHRGEVGNPSPSTARPSTRRDLAGTLVLVGVYRSDQTIELPFLDVFPGRGGSLKSSW